ncbi:MAG: hypothetical protein KA604_00475 [Candidatus Saccharimonas sp.]|jgi:hypothetical protein|nr:hypothetical protein [Candidatus Saccharimonas sp.]
MKNKILPVIIIIICAASVAYAAFASTLNVNGTGTATGNWQVEIISITATGQVGATDQVAPSFTATSATFNVGLAYPGATSSYQVAIKNKGNISAKLSSLTSLAAINSAAPTYLTYALSGVAVNDVLAPNATTTATVSVSWDAAANTNPSGANKSATITFNYVQN